MPLAPVLRTWTTLGSTPAQKRRLDGNLTNSTLNRLAWACLAKMIRSCGQSVRVEVTETFNNVDPTSNQRMYLVDYDPRRSNQLYDAVATNPATAAVLRFNITNLWVAWTQQRTKEKRYQVAATNGGILLHGLIIEVFYGRCTMGRWFFLYAQSFHFLWSRQHQIFLGLFKPTIGVVEFRCVCRVELLPTINAFNTRKSQQAYGKNFGHRRSTHRHSSHGEAFLLPWLNRGTFGGVLRRGPYRAGLRRKLKRRRDLEQKFYGQLCVENLLRVVLNNFKTNISRDSIV